jgi:hypothetical protein
MNIMKGPLCFAALALSNNAAFAQGAAALPAQQQVAEATALAVYSPARNDVGRTVEVRRRARPADDHANPTGQLVYSRDGTVSLWQPHDN